MGIVNVTNPGNDNDIRPNLQTAINAASNGDTVVLPAGQFTYSGSGITTTKKINLQGSGIGAGGTLLYRNVDTSDNDDFIHFEINSSTDVSMVVSGIYFKGKQPRLDTSDTTNSKSDDYALRFHRAPGFVVHDCRFDWFGHAAIEVEQDISNNKGLIYNCIFNQCVKVDTGQSRGTTTGYGVLVFANTTSSAWGSDFPDFHTADYLFVENCLFIRCRHAIASTFNSKYTLRYNDCIDHYYAAAVDAHGPTTGSGQGSMISIIYNNNIRNNSWLNSNKAWSNIYADSPETSINSNLTFSAIRPRGGSGIIEDNVIEGYRNGVDLNIDYDDASYPQNGQIGFNSGDDLGSGHTGYDTAAKRDGDFFVYNNTWIEYTGSSGGVEVYEQIPDYVEGRDYHLVEYSTISGVTDGTRYTYPHPDRLDTIPSGDLYDDDADLAGHWLFNNNLLDATPNGNDLTGSGSPTFSATAQEGAYSLDLERDSSQYAYITDAAQSNLNPDGSLALMGWVRFETAVADENIFSKWDFGNNQRSYSIHLDGDVNLRFAVSQDGASQIGINYDTPSTATWHHIAGVFDAETGFLKLYFNNALVGILATDYTGNYDSTSRVQVGAMLNNTTAVQFMDGLIDDLSFWKRALITEEIDSHYNNGIQAAGGGGGGGSDAVYTTDPNLQGLWRLEETSGTRADSSVNGNDLTDNNTVGSSTDAQQGTRSADFERDNSESLSITDASQTGLGATTALSFGGWYKFEGSGVEYDLIGKHGGSGDRGYVMLVTSLGDVNFYVSDDGTNLVNAKTATGLITSGVWRHIVGVYNGIDLRIYLDGALSSNGANNPLAYTSDINDNNQPFMLGSRPTSSNYFDGLMDEQFVFDRALSAAEVADIYSNGIRDPGFILLPEMIGLKQLGVVL